MMRDRNSDDLTSWEKAFVELNEKLGNEVWGAREESDGSGKQRLRIFINDESWKKKVLEETGGQLADHALVFTVYSQETHAFAESHRRRKEEELRKAEKDAETKTSTCDVDGDVQRNSG